jgi:ATP-dependent protease ClpP protease subunit
MIAKIYIEGEIGYDSTLLDVMTQFKNFANPESVEVHINSIGGSVKVGNDIYNYLKNLPIPVTTIANMAYSIAATIFMAGNTRIALQGADRLMIHFPFVMGFTGGSEELTDMSKQLKTLEGDMIKFYSGYLPDIDAATISNLLENETFISGDEAFALGFATQLDIPLQAVAYFGDTRPEKSINNNNDKNAIMTKFNELIEAIKGFKIGGSTEGSGELVSLVLQDANGVEITFPDVAEDAVPVVGDSATVDGQPAEGEYLSPEGSKWIFAGGILTELVPAEEETPEEEAARLEQERLDAEAAAANADTLPEVLSAEELNSLLAELFAKAGAEVEAKLIALYDVKLQAIEDANKAEIVALKKLIGSPEIEETPEEIAAKNKLKGNSLAQTLRA